ncbi:MAG: pyridoxamine 5'-phosphate oxidase family protein [Anaerolineae bacterium]
MNDDTFQIVRVFLETQSTMALATVNGEGQPESVPLFYVSDDRLNLYWLSATHVRHSVNLAANGRVSATVYPPVWQWNEISGVQIEGTASMVSDERVREQILLLYLRKFQLPPELDKVIAGSSLYVLEPTWLRWVDNSVAFGHKVEMEL